MDLDLKMEDEKRDLNKFFCQFCNSSFVSQKNLDGHLKNAKYCLAIRGEAKDTNLCIGCNKPFSTRHWLTTHQVA